MIHLNGWRSECHARGQETSSSVITPTEFPARYMVRTFLPPSHTIRLPYPMFLDIVLMKNLVTQESLILSSTQLKSPPSADRHQRSFNLPKLTQPS